MADSLAAIDQLVFREHRLDLSALVTELRQDAPRLGQADLILVGVSRSGKTPTSLYLALQFGIRSIPTLVLYTGGREAARTAGAMDVRGLMAWAQQHL